MFTVTSDRFFLMQSIVTDATFSGFELPAILGAWIPFSSHRSYMPASVTNPGHTTEKPTGDFSYSARRHS